MKKSSRRLRVPGFGALNQAVNLANSAATCPRSRQQHRFEQETLQNLATLLYPKYLAATDFGILSQPHSERPLGPSWLAPRFSNKTPAGEDPQYDPAVYWYQFLRTGYVWPADPSYRFLQTGYGRPARPGRILTGYGRPARPGRIWYPFLQTGYGQPARPGRILVPVFTDRIRTARPTRPYFGNGSSRPYTAGSTGPGRVGSQTDTLELECWEQLDVQEKLTLIDDSSSKRTFSRQFAI
ncbi:hypothetical protein BC829DRAFT_448393 [Chytridium lagenaria]|nr:hypothetical protein BC829DRAFT_448393 [Chytridium lagenaria]